MLSQLRKQGYQEANCEREESKVRYIEYESLKRIDEGSMKKINKKGSTSKCSYCRKGFNPENKIFNNNTCMYFLSS